MTEHPTATGSYFSIRASRSSVEASLGRTCVVMPCGSTASIAIQRQMHTNAGVLDDRPHVFLGAGSQNRQAGAQVFPQLARNKPLHASVAGGPRRQQAAVGGAQVRGDVPMHDDTVVTVV